MLKLEVVAAPVAGSGRPEGRALSRFTLPAGGDVPRSRIL